MRKRLLLFAALLAAPIAWAQTNSPQIRVSPSASLAPQQYRVQLRVTPAQIGALNSTPLTLLAGITGKTIVPDYTLWERELGATYTAGSATSVVARGTATNSIVGSTLDMTLFTATTGPAVIVNSGPVTQIIANPITGWTRAGEGIQLYAQGGNPTPGDGDLVVTMYYRVW